MSHWKLVSTAKVAANQANARLSTGPKTPEGKAHSSQNALKHGLSARELVICPEDRPAYDELHAAYLADLQPEGIVEVEMFNAIVHAAWNLRRVRTLEAQLFDGATDPLLDEQNEAKLDRLSRYHRRFENTLHRSLRELRTLQSVRAARSQAAFAGKVALADPHEVARAKRSQSSASSETLKSILSDLERQDREMFASIRADMQNEANRDAAA